MKNYFGGEHLQQKRKSQRPLDFKKSTHLVLRLKEHLPALLNPRDKTLRKGFQQLAQKYNIRVYQLIFNHTHLHSVVLIPDRKSYVGFIRELTSKLVRYFSRATKIKFSKIFLNRPFTRIVSWGRAFSKIYQYMKKNERESGVMQFRKTKKQKVILKSKFQRQVQPPSENHSEILESQLQTCFNLSL